MEKNEHTSRNTLRKMIATLRLSLKDKQVLLFAILSIAFTIWYCKFIFSPSSMMLGNNINDAYQLFEGFKIDYTFLQSGHLPFGVYWVPNLVGGSVATWFYLSVLPDISLSSFFVIFSALKNPVLSLKIVAFITLFISQFCSYKLAKHYFKKSWIAWIFSIAYSFSSFYYSQVNDGHISFIMGAALLPATLLLFEKMLASPNRKNMLFASTGLIILFLADIQTMIFALFYLLLRVIYYFIINYKKNSNTDLLKRLLELIVLVSLFAAPFLLSFSILQNTGALSVTSNSIPSNWIILPSQLFSRGSGQFSGSSLIVSFYLGISLLAISLVPMFLSRSQSKRDSRNYLFHWMTFAFFVLVAIGTPLDIFVTSFFVRVPDRGLSLIIFSLCMCAGYGLLSLSDFFNQKSTRFHWLKSKTLKTILIICLATIIFADLTFGLQPLTSPVPTLTSGDHFIANQTGDFRVLKYPILWGDTNYESSLINHEMVGEPVMSLRSYPENSELFIDLTEYFNEISVPSNFNQTTGNWNIIASTLTAFATLGGAKYVLIEKNQPESSNYINFFGNSTKYFALVFNGTDSVVYENLYFEGMVFVLKDNGELPILGNFTMDDLSTFSLSDILENFTVQELAKDSLPDAQISYTQGFNEIQLSGNLSEPAYVVISQSYYPYWAVNNGDQTTFTNFLNVTALEVSQGTFNATATFSVGDQTQNLYIAFYIPLISVGLLFYADWKAKKGLFRLASSLLIASGIVLVSLVFLQKGAAPSLNWTDFGPFSKLVIEFGALIAIAGVLGLVKNKVLEYTNRFLINIAKLFINNIKTALKSFVNYFDSIIESLKSRVNFSDSIDKSLKFLIASLLVYICIINLPLPKSNTVSWVEPSFVGGMLLLVVVLYALNVSVADKKPVLFIPPVFGNPSKSLDSKQNRDIHYLLLGIFGGMLGVCVGGLLMRVITSYSQGYVSLGLFLCTALGGLGFVALTSGNNRLRGIIGCFFGVIAIVFGLIMTYTTPIIIGYMQTIGTSTPIPLYKWHEYTFARFFTMQLFTSDSLFFFFFGLTITYLGASRLGLKFKSKKEPLDK